MGDPLRLLQLKVILEVIETEKLQDRVNAAGSVIREGLAGLASEYPDIVSGVRGQGTLCAFNMHSAAARDALMPILRSKVI